MQSHLDSNEMSLVRSSLEDFYLNLPADFLHFDSVQKAYQAEAMIWIHGIFILSCKRTGRNYKTATVLC